MLDSKSFWKTIDLACREVDTMAVWRSLSIKDKEKALRLLLGPHWKRLYKDVIERYGEQFSR